MIISIVIEKAKDKTQGLFILTEGRKGVRKRKKEEGGKEKEGRNRER